MALISSSPPVGGGGGGAGGGCDQSGGEVMMGVVELELDHRVAREAGMVRRY